MVSMSSDSQGFVQRPGNGKNRLFLIMLILGFLLQLFNCPILLLMISLTLTIKEEAFGRTILLGEIPYLHSADQMNVKVSFSLLIFKEWR